jgi:HJR/Mrr/RecB family endonuclease
MIHEFVVGQNYSNEEIFRSLQVGNSGGIRLSTHGNAVLRAAVMTSVENFHMTGENPYHDRIEGEILTYTAAGKSGEQTLAGVNSRLIEQRYFDFPIDSFVLIASRRDRSVGPKRWRYLGLLEYLRHYPDTQIDSDGKVRKVWIFEFRIHQEPIVVPLEHDVDISSQLLVESRKQQVDDFDNEILDVTEQESSDDLEQIERIRGSMLSMEPRNFEHLIKDVLVHTGFTEVAVTKYSSDGGVDVNAKAGNRMWLFESTVVQVQAKRWLHSVGRKEVAELRGSLQPFARGAVITTSHFSKAALIEAVSEGKNPIALVDGFRLSKLILDEGISVQTSLSAVV